MFGLIERIIGSAGYPGIALLMLAVTALASLLPAWRASRADPAVVFRP